MILEPSRTITVTKPRRATVAVDRPGTSVTIVVGRGPQGIDGAANLPDVIDGNLTNNSVGV